MSTFLYVIMVDNLHPFAHRVFRIKVEHLPWLDSYPVVEPFNFCSDLWHVSDLLLSCVDDLPKVSICQYPLASLTLTILNRQAACRTSSFLASMP